MNHLSKALGLVLIALVTTGCMSSTDPTSDGTDPIQSTPEASASQSVQSTPTEDATPTVPSATGETIKVKGMKVNLPADWAKSSTSAIQASGYIRTNARSFLALFRFPQLLVESLDEQAKDNSTRSDWNFKLKRKDDVTVDGQVVSHLSGKVNSGEHVDLFSTLLNEEQLELQFNFGNAESKAERDELVQSVLASWKFTG